MQGDLQPTSVNSLLGARVDYRTGENYTYSVLYTGPCAGSPLLYNPQRSAPVPFGTRRPADEVVVVPDLAAFDLEIAARAPTGWDGRAQVVVILQDAGPTARARVRFARP
jgi:hypothetical protein